MEHEAILFSTLDNQIIVEGLEKGDIVSFKRSKLQTSGSDKFEVKPDFVGWDTLVVVRNKKPVFSQAFEVRDPLVSVVDIGSLPATVTIDELRSRMIAIYRKPAYPVRVTLLRANGDPVPVDYNKAGKEMMEKLLASANSGDQILVEPKNTAGKFARTFKIK
jgi:hypothetical protein